MYNQMFIQFLIYEYSSIFHKSNFNIYLKKKVHLALLMSQVVETLPYRP